MHSSALMPFSWFYLHDYACIPYICVLSTLFIIYRQLQNRLTNAIQCTGIKLMLTLTQNETVIRLILLIQWFWILSTSVNTLHIKSNIHWENYLKYHSVRTTFFLNFIFRFPSTHPPPPPYRLSHSCNGCLAFVCVKTHLCL